MLKKKSTCRRIAALVLLPLFGALLSVNGLANKPLFIPIDDTYVHSLHSSQCGFPVQLHVTGTLVVRFPAQGPLEVILGANYQVTYTNLETGKSVSSRQSGLEKLWDVEFEAESNLLILHYASTGAERIIVPGETTVVRSGSRLTRLTIDLELWEPVAVEVTMLGGRGDDFEALLCELLAP